MARPSTACVSLALALCASLSAQLGVTVVKEAFPTGEVAPGETIDYRVQVVNPNAFDLPVGFFLDFIPDNTTYQSGTLTLDPFVPDVLWHSQGVIFNTGDLLLPASGATTVEFTVRVNDGVAPGTLIENFADTDYGLSNSVFNSVAAESQLVSVLDADPPGLISPGEVITYTLTILNFGFAPATGIQIVADRPAFTAFEPGSIQLLGTTGNVTFTGDTVHTDAAGLTLEAGGVAQLNYGFRVDNPLPDDVLILHAATVNGVATNLVGNFTVTLSDYVDLESVPGNVVVNDLNVFDRTGFAFGGADFDNDGKGDLIIGDPTAFAAGATSGAVYVVYGGFLLTESVVLPDSGAAITEILPPIGTSFFGQSIATGDLTGDGIEDILIGAPGPSGSPGPGQAFLIQGGGFTPVIDLGTNPGLARTVFNGVGGELLGWTVAAGDFSGDGVEDAILGAPNHVPSGVIVGGRVAVVPGGSSLPTTVNLIAPPAGTSFIVGSQGNGGSDGIANTPSSLAAGDVNGDGLDDVVIGSIFAPTPTGGVESGQAFVVRGSATPVTLNLANPPSGWTAYQSPAGGGQMGWSVVAGDFNGDRFDDVAFGAPQATWILTPGGSVFPNSGVVFALLGRSDLSDGVVDLATDPPGLTTLFGETDGDLMGWSLAAGDHNGDGRDDLLIGAPLAPNFIFEEIGTAYLLLGTPRLRRQYLNLFAPTGVLRFYADSGSEAAFQALGVGDLNSDGFADLFLGDEVFDPFTSGATDGDETHVFFGKPRAPRLELAVASEFGETDLVLQTGEQLILQFDQPVTVTEGLIQPGDFFLTNPGATLGTQSTLAANPNDPTQAIITLGSDFANLVIGGFDPATSTFIDIGSSIRAGLITGTDNDLPAEDTGFINSDDRGVDILWTLNTIPQVLTSGAGGTVTVTENADQNRPDFAYTEHTLTVPAGALSRDTRLAIARTPSSLSGLDLRNAVQITDDDPGTPTFGQPVTLVLEYREEDLALTPGGIESLFRVFQVVDSAGGSAKEGLPGYRRLGTGQTLREVQGTQVVDTASNTVTIQLNTLDPEGASGDVGVFATLPVSTVEERTVHVAPAPGAAATVRSITPSQGVGSGGTYTLHEIEFIDFDVVAPGTPGSTQVTLRAATALERNANFAAGANRFPTESGAVFTVETRDTGGALVSFTDPVDVRVQFIDRPAPADSDIIDFSSAPGDPQQMRFVQSLFSLADGTDFQFRDRPQTVDLAQGTVTMQGLTNLTGQSGIGVCGAVVDQRVGVVTSQRVLQALLGQATLTLAERTAADVSGDGRLDVADLVRLVNAQ